MFRLVPLLTVFILSSEGLHSDGLHWDGLRSESRSSESVPSHRYLLIPRKNDVTFELRPHFVKTLKYTKGILKEVGSKEKHH